MRGAIELQDVLKVRICPLPFAIYIPSPVSIRPSYHGRCMSLSQDAGQKVKEFHTKQTPAS